METLGIAAKPFPVTSPGPIRVPKFLVEHEPRYRLFFSNLIYLMFSPRPRGARPTPGEFWYGVMLEDNFPWVGVRRSLLAHVLVICAVCALTIYGFFGTRPQEVRNPFRNTIVYYSVADYLPELNTMSSPAKVELKGEPAYAKQEIISVPPQPDNTRQTIITPWDVKLKTPVKLPNMVAWNPEMPALPMSATPGKQVRVPLQPQVVAPPPEVTREGTIRLPSELLKVTAVPPTVDPLTGPRSKLTTSQPEAVLPGVEPVSPARRTLTSSGPRVVPPSVELEAQNRALPNVSVPSAVAPAADLGDLRRRPGAMNISSAMPQVQAPALPVPEQRALGVGRAVSGGGEGGNAGTNGGRTQASDGTATPGAAAQAAGGGQQKGSGQLIALGLDPVDPKGPIEIPAGTRSGIFAASPEGKPGAPGTPTVQGGGTGTGGTSTANGQGSGPGTRTSPEGVFVGRGGTPAAGPVAASKPLPEGPHGETAGGTSARERLLAAARAPDIPRASTVPPANKEEREIADKVFGPKKYYSLTLNMPNLSSSTGSWVIRFAELKQGTAAAEVSGPVPIKKVDPAYPAESLRDKVEGTVILYAVIHADGTVGEIRVLSGVEEHLDQSAMKALARWQFRPGTRNGEPVDLEAVVQIPFRTRKSLF